MFNNNKLVVVNVGQKTADRNYSPFVPDPLEDIAYGITDAVESLAHFAEKVVYWFNPSNLWYEFGLLMHHPNTASVMVCTTIISFWLILAGFQSLKKWNLLGLAAYFTLFGITV